MICAQSRILPQGPTNATHATNNILLKNATGVNHNDEQPHDRLLSFPNLCPSTKKHEKDIIKVIKYLVRGYLTSENPLMCFSAVVSVKSCIEQRYVGERTLNPRMNRASRTLLPRPFASSHSQMYTIVPETCWPQIFQCRSDFSWARRVCGSRIPRYTLLLVSL